MYTLSKEYQELNAAAKRKNEEKLNWIDVMSSDPYCVAGKCRESLLAFSLF